MEYDKYLDGLPKLPENCQFCIREAKLKDSFLIGKIINKAFVEADAWFKKPEYHLRFDKNGERMKQYISESDRSRILWQKQTIKIRFWWVQFYLIGRTMLVTVSLTLFLFTCIHQLLTLNFLLGLCSNVYFFKGCT